MKCSRETKRIQQGKHQHSLEMPNQNIRVTSQLSDHKAKSSLSTGETISFSFDSQETSLSAKSSSWQQTTTKHQTSHSFSNQRKEIWCTHNVATNRELSLLHQIFNALISFQKTYERPNHYRELKCNLCCNKLRTSNSLRQICTRQFKRNVNRP